MSDLVVRATQESDLPRISELTESVFGVRRDVPLLRWLLHNPHAPERIDSWIAERNGVTLGHTAILKCRYRVAERWMTGAHGYLWMVDPQHRGRAGMRLGCRIRTYDDFQILIGGSGTTKTIVAGRRFLEVAEAREYRLSSPPDDRDPPIGGAVGGCVSPPHSPRGDGTAIELKAVQSFSGAAPLPAGYVVNEATPEHLEWLAGCPDLEAHRYELELRGRYLGPVLLYVNRRTSPIAGRLVHLPCLSEEPELWRAVLDAVARELAALRCPSWTLLATHPALVQACEAAEATIVGRRPVWIREQEETLAPHIGAWHLTYLEGDLAYRRVQDTTSTT